MADYAYNVKSGFYDSVNHDRLYSAADMAEPYKGLFTEGIFEGGLEVTPTSPASMKISLTAGRAIGLEKWVDVEAMTIDVPANTTVSYRADCVVLSINNGVAYRKAQVIYRTNSRTLNNTATQREWMLAKVDVEPGATEIENISITDNRGESDCPYATLNVGANQLEETLMDLIEEHPELITAVPDGGITTAKLADGAVTLQKLASSVIDSTLTQAGKAADAKATGDAITDLNNDLSKLGLSVVNGELCVTYTE